MRDHQEDTPPSSMYGDEITNMPDEEIVYLDEDDEYMAEDFDEVEPPDDHAILTFSKHTGSVFCSNFDPEGKMAVTGGEDDKAFVWDVDTGDILMECTGHKDSIIYVGFSFDGVYLATADMSGVIKVWKCDTESQIPWTTVFEYETGDLSWGFWHFGARVLFFGTVAGDIYLFKIPSGETKVLQGHTVKAECGKLFKDGVRLAVGYDDGAIKIWDLKTTAVIHHVSASVHQCSVTAIDTHPEGNLIASISTNGKIVLTTPSNGKVVAQLEAETELETVAFAEEPLLGYLAVGSLVGTLGIWDVARQMIRHHCSDSKADLAGATTMFWVKNHLVSGCVDGSIRIYDGRSGKLQSLLTGHISEILDLRYNKKRNLLLTTSDDSTARIFKYEVVEND